MSFYMGEINAYTEFKFALNQLEIDQEKSRKKNV